MIPSIDLKSSKIYIRRGVLDETGALIQSEYPDAKVLVVTDQTVGQIYLDRMAAELYKSGIDYDTIVFKDGESTKSLKNIEALCEKAADMALNRGDVIVAFGGGVIGDLAGFAAAVYLRGIAFVAIPTTLLAQVDSSVGGKTGVNLKQGKNLVGSFYKADHVLIDPETLLTLNERQFQCGMAEVIKYGCIWDANLFQLLESMESRDDAMAHMDDIVKTCCEIKAEVVLEDEFDKGLRMKLNFGHTIGHAYENVLGYGKVTHGEAIAAGMVQITCASEKAGITQQGSAERIKALLMRQGLAPEIKGVKREAILKAIQKDKKRIGKAMNIIVLKQIGEAEIKAIQPEEMEAFV